MQLCSTIVVQIWSVPMNKMYCY